MLGKRTLAGQGDTKQASITDFKIDRAGPIISVYDYMKADGLTYTSGTWSTQNVKFTVSVSDSGSGVTSRPTLEDISIKDGSTVGIATNEFITSADGKYESATVSCSDVVGNTTTVNLEKIWVDTVPPSVAEDSVLELVAEGGSVEWSRGSLLAVRGTISDSGSGLAYETIDLTNAVSVGTASNTRGWEATGSSFPLEGVSQHGSVSRNLGILDSKNDYITVNWTISDMARKYS